MEKIDFVNSQQPAINDTNLNLLQDNIERAINAQVSGDTLPIGTLLPYTSTSIPDNWLLCDGRAISRTTYSQLYNVIGTRYGEGDGSTTFNLPDLRGKVPVGYDSTQTEFNSTGKTGGEKTHTLTISEMPEHRHTITPRNNSATGLYELKATNATGDTGSANTGYAGGGQAHNNLQPYIVIRYIIKAFQTAGTVADIVNVKSTSTTNAYSASYINSLNNYSTTEKYIGSWIGSDLYRKVINIGNLPNTTYKDVAHNISNLNKVVHIYGYFYNPTNTTYDPIPYVATTSAESNVGVYVYGSSVRILTGIDRSNCTGYVVLEYTKTS